MAPHSNFEVYKSLLRINPFFSSVLIAGVNVNRFTLNIFIMSSNIEMSMIQLWNNMLQEVITKICQNQPVN